MSHGRTIEEWQEDVRKILKKNNCKLVSALPSRIDHELTARCCNHEEGPDAPLGYYEWPTTPARLFKGKGCPLCSKRAPLTRARILASASQVHLTLDPVSQDIPDGISNTNYLDFRCDNCGVTKPHRIGNIRTGHGCKNCASVTIGEARRITDEELIDWLACDDLTLISREFRKGIAYVKFGCRRGHTPTQPWGVVSRGNGCPDCAMMPHGETVTRQLFEYLTGFTWTKDRVSWMRSDLGNPLELDGYNEERRCGFEFQGEQHDVDNGYFPRAKYDHLKVEGCRKQGVTLVIVLKKDYDAAKKSGGQEGLLLWAIGLLKAAGIPMLANPGRLVLKLNTPRSDALTIEANALAEAKGGEFVDDVCTEAEAEHNWRCKDHGTFKRSLSVMKQREFFCPYCGGEQRAENRRLEYATISVIRREFRRLGLQNEREVAKARDAGDFGEIVVPSALQIYLDLTPNQVFQKTTKLGEPWQYIDEHDNPADLALHPRRYSTPIHLGKGREAKKPNKRSPGAVSRPEPTVG